MSKELQRGDHVVAPHPARDDELHTGIIVDNLSSMYVVYFSDGAEHFLFKAQRIEKLDVTVEDELKRIHTCCYGDPDMRAAAGRVLEADLNDEQRAEALRRIRSKTTSLMMQWSITAILGDCWEATPENSKVQPYEE